MPDPIVSPIVRSVSFRYPLNSRLTSAMYVMNIWSECRWNSNSPSTRIASTQRGTFAGSMSSDRCGTNYCLLPGIRYSQVAAVAVLAAPSSVAWAPSSE